MNDFITLEVNGNLYQNFTSINVFRDIESFLGEFEFIASNTKRQNFPFSKGQKAIIYIDGKKIITGYINTLSGKYSSEDHNISIRGRDITQDIVDSSIKEQVDFKDKIGIKSIIEKVLKVNNVTGITVTLNETVADFSKNELISAEVGANAFEFIDQCCRLRQLLLTTDIEGNIVLTKAGTNEYNLMLLNGSDDKKNNILRASFNDSDEQRFNNYIIYSQGNILSQILDKEKEKKKGSTQDTNIRTSRTIVINSTISGDVQTNNDRAKWESNIRRTRGFFYKCRIRGYYLDDNKTELIKPNNLITVQDDIVGISATLLIKSCRYIKSLEGSFTDIELVNKDSYTLQQQQDAITSSFDKTDNILAQLGL